HGSSGSSQSIPVVTPISGTASSHDNYFNPSGAYGAFYPDSFIGWSVSNNIDMTNGKTINADDSESATSSPHASTSVAPAPATPTITPFSPDTGSAADVTDANVLTVTGTAAASSTVNLYDGSASIGTATADASGAWRVATSTLTDGLHIFTATD